MATVNVALTLPLTFRDVAGTLVTGKVDGDFTKTAFLASDGATTATVTVAAITGQAGKYGATFEPTAVGLWSVEVECTHSGQTYRWSEDVDVVTAAQADPVAGFLSRSVTMTSPLNAATGTMTVIKGDDYLAADSRSFTFDASGYPSLIGATVEWRAIRDGRIRLTKAATVVDADSVRVELADTDTSKLRVGATYTYAVVETAPDDLTLATGSLVVTS